MKHVDAVKLFFLYVPTVSESRVKINEMERVCELAGTDAFSKGIETHQIKEIVQNCSLHEFHILSILMQFSTQKAKEKL